MFLISGKETIKIRIEKKQNNYFAITLQCHCRNSAPLQLRVGLCPIIKEACCLTTMEIKSVDSCSKLPHSKTE